jgi:hypothetical protein
VDADLPAVIFQIQASELWRDFETQNGTGRGHGAAGFRERGLYYGAGKKVCVKVPFPKLKTSL